MPGAAELSFNPAFAMLVGAAVAWYIASRAAVDALAGGMPAPGRRAIGYWMPMALIALLAAAGNQPEIAVGVVFSASIASLSLVIGVVTLTSPPNIMVVSDRRRWAFVLPAAVLAVLAGFKARLTIMHAAVFSIEGMALLWLWNDSSDIAELHRAAPAGRPRRRHPLLIALQLLIAIGLATVGAVAAIFSSVQIGREWDLPGNALIGAMLLGPALVVPMVGSSTLMAQRGQYSAAVSSAVAVVLLNLCLLLPLVIIQWNVGHAPNPIDIAKLARATFASDPPLFYAPSVWRVDASLLVVLGLWLLPVSVGRWIPSRLEGAALVACYAVYLIMSAWANRYW